MNLSPLTLALSWCDESRDLLGLPARPLSLVSHHLLRLIQPRILLADPGELTEQGEVADMILFAWLHTAPLDEVTETLWSGAWRALISSAPDPATMGDALVEWRDRRARMVALCDAVDYEIAARPKRESSGSSSAPVPPSNMMYPTRLAYRIRLLMRDTGVSRLEALWEFPYWQAVQICHAAQRYEGDWTVPMVARTAPAEFGGFDLAPED